MWAFWVAAALAAIGAVAPLSFSIGAHSRLQWVIVPFGIAAVVLGINAVMYHQGRSLAAALYFFAGLVMLYRRLGVRPRQRSLWPAKPPAQPAPPAQVAPAPATPVVAAPAVAAPAVAAPAPPRAPRSRTRPRAKARPLADEPKELPAPEEPKELPAPAEAEEPPPPA